MALAAFAYFERLKQAVAMQASVHCTERYGSFFSCTAGGAAAPLASQLAKDSSPLAILAVRVRFSDL